MVWRKMVAEFVGTFAWVFIGCGAIIAQSALGTVKAIAAVKGVATPSVVLEVNPIAYLTVALAFGLTVAVMVYAAGHISAAHFNPAVTIGFAVAGRFPWRYVPHYLVAQCAGAFFASLIHYAFFSGEAVNVNFGVTVLSPDVPPLYGFLVEMMLTFLLGFVAMAVATDTRFPSSAAGLAIGLVVTVCMLMGGVWTGASMNPARSLAPAVFASRVEPQALAQVWIYLVAPVVGAAIAARVYEFLRLGEFAQGAPADLLALTAAKEPAAP
ncbi:Aquaporin Z 2 [bacterium HR17]|uniref:Aquaporin Z 2 n=1 Tax=Candidatus Fervidibacter japonicus TaxID=2035412 RepID=A0A2H5XF68_9BACT|nr:Aquaporin Z 2 [bacterium HR17]